MVVMRGAYSDMSLRGPAMAFSMTLIICNRALCALASASRRSSGVTPGDFDVHLDGRDAFARAGDLEIHVAHVIFGAENIGEDSVARTVCYQSHCHSRNVRLDGHARGHRKAC